MSDSSSNIKYFACVVARNLHFIHFPNTHSKLFSEGSWYYKIDYLFFGWNLYPFTTWIKKTRKWRMIDIKFRDIDAVRIYLGESVLRIEFANAFTSIWTCINGIEAIRNGVRKFVIVRTFREVLFGEVIFIECRVQVVRTQKLKLWRDTIASYRADKAHMYSISIYPLTQPSIINIFLTIQIIIHFLSIKNSSPIIFKNKVRSQGSFNKRLNNLNLDVDSCGEEQNKCKDNWNYYGYFYVLVLLCLYVL